MTVTAPVTVTALVTVTVTAPVTVTVTAPVTAPVTVSLPGPGLPHPPLSQGRARCERQVSQAGARR